MVPQLMPFAFGDSLYARQSLGNFIGPSRRVDGVQQDIHPPCRRQAVVVGAIRGVNLGVGAELADDLLHGAIAPDVVPRGARYSISIASPYE